jgi:hypothetical protein
MGVDIKRPNIHIPECILRMIRDPAERPEEIDPEVLCEIYGLRRDIIDSNEQLDMFGSPKK